VGTFTLTLGNLNYSMEVREDELVFLGIIKDADTVIAHLPKPAATVEHLQNEQGRREAALQGYADVDETIVQKYTESKNQLGTLQDLLAKHQKEVQECEGKFKTAVDNLEDALIKWQQIVSKKFQAIMNGLQLDASWNSTRIRRSPGTTN